MTDSCLFLLIDIETSIAVFFFPSLFFPLYLLDHTVSLVVCFPHGIPIKLS